MDVFTAPPAHTLERTEDVSQGGAPRGAAATDLERAVNEERTIAEKRAEQSKSTLFDERVLGTERTNGFERATVPKSPGVAERTRSDESTQVEKRAGVRESTPTTERAVPSERTDIGERPGQLPALPPGLRPPAPPLDFNSESRLVRLARELAMEMRGPDAILHDYSVDADEWDSLTRNPWFQSLLASELQQWNNAGSTHDRVRVKSAVLVEEWLLEANRRLHDPHETLSSKVELFKTLARIANLGTGDEVGAGGGFRVVINIGSHQVTRTIAARLNESTIDDERADVSESTSRPKRAIPTERTDSEEQAAKVEGTQNSERADGVEQTFSVSRGEAPQGAAAVTLKRAEYQESTIQHVRAGNAESTKQIERERFILRVGPESSPGQVAGAQGMVRPALTATPGSPRHGQVVPRELSAAALKGGRR